MDTLHDFNSTKSTGRTTLELVLIVLLLVLMIVLLVIYQKVLENSSKIEDLENRLETLVAAQGNVPLESEVAQKQPSSAATENAPPRSGEGTSLSLLDSPVTSENSRNVRTVRIAKDGTPLPEEVAEAPLGADVPAIPNPNEKDETGQGGDESGSLREGVERVRSVVVGQTDREQPSTDVQQSKTIAGVDVELLSCDNQPEEIVCKLRVRTKGNADKPLAVRNVRTYAVDFSNVRYTTSSFRFSDQIEDEHYRAYKTVKKGEAVDLQFRFYKVREPVLALKTLQLNIAKHHFIFKNVLVN